MNNATIKFKGNTITIKTILSSNTEMIHKIIEDNKLVLINENNNQYYWDRVFTMPGTDVSIEIDITYRRDILHITIVSDMELIKTKVLLDLLK